jgi:drug/metabolite transporter (DMT)-like permease
MGFTPMEIVFIRVTVAAAAMIWYCFITDPRKLNIRLKDSFWFLGTGIGSLVFFNWCYFHAMDKTSLATAALLLYTAPVFVLLMSCLFLGEQITKKKAAAMAIVFAGSALSSGILTEQGNPLSWPGIFYGLGAGFGYGLYSIFGTVLLRKYQAETVSTYTFVFAAAGAAPAFVSGFQWSGLACLSKALWPALGIGILSSMLPFLLYTRGLKLVSASKASGVAAIEPVAAAAVGLVFFEETLDGGKILGIIMTLWGIFLLKSAE